MPFATRRYIRRKRKQAKRPKKKRKPRKKGILQILTDLYHSKAPKKGIVPYRFKPLKLDRPGHRAPRPWQDGGYRDFGDYPWRYNNPPGQEIYDHLH